MPHREMSWSELDKRFKEQQEKLTPETAPFKAKSVTKFDDDVYNLVEELAELLLSKHKDYGPTNISRAPGGALNGLRVRIHDKIARINNLIDSGKNPEHESLEDSFKDLANYAIIALMVTRGKWPEK